MKIDYLNNSSGSYNIDDLIAKAASKALSKHPARYKETIPELIERLNKDQDPPWVNPKHLQPLFDVFDKIQQGEKVNFLLSVPPRHGKSQTVLHGILRYFLTHKNKSVLYICYNHDLAEEQSREIRARALKAGLKFLKDSNSVGAWRLSNGCKFRASSIVSGNVTGYSADIIIVDDPFKDRADAESIITRNKVYEVFQSAAVSRNPKAIIVISTRWHEDDLIGRLSKIQREDGSYIYPYINIPALNELGEPLWPEVRSLDWLRDAKRQSEYNWAALYMGQPVPKGASLFNPVPETNFYKELPLQLYYSIGIDLAYTAQTHADYSVAVVLASDGNKIYVVDTIRLQASIMDVARKLEALRYKYPKSPFLSFISGPEKGNIEQLNGRGLNIVPIPTNKDKFQRAQAVSAAWNSGKIHLPLEDSKWKREFLEEVLHFSGVGDATDDQVDALAGAYAGLSARPVRRDFTNFF